MLQGPPWAAPAALLLALLAGCSSPTLQPSRLTPVPSAGESERTASITAPTVALRQTPPAVAAAAPGPPGREILGHDDGPSGADARAAASTRIDGPADEWISLESWSAANHFGATQSAPSTLGSGCAVRTPGGLITLIAGSQIARLDGINCWLGFAPRVADGRLLVHALDARKNLLPVTNRPEPRLPARRVVVIDPGHGGENAGAQSVADHRWEKEFTLDWALRLRPLLERNGWNVVLTRTSDADISLSDRVAAADKANATLFVSLHFNSGARPDHAGLETYCLTPMGMPSTLTRDYEDDASQEYPNNSFDAENLEYAVRLQRCLLEETGCADRGVRRARFMVVLRGQKRPAVLVEGGYLSNPREARAIADPAYRQRLANAVAKALLWSDPASESPHTAHHAAQ